MITKIQYTDQASRQAVLDANKDKTLIEEDNITEGNFLIFSDQVIEGNDLSQVQQLKLAQINDLYNQKLASGFTSSASGTALTYGYAATDQMKFMQVALEVLLSPTTAFPVTVHPKDGSSVALDQAQYSQLVSDIAAFAKPLDAKQHDYITQVNACTTVDQINAIVVSF